MFTFFVFAFLAIRGGISQCSNRYAKANNKYMSDYDEQKPTSYLMYFDVNSLYAYAMTQSLPLGEFEWITVSEKNINEVLHATNDSEFGYMIEADFHYPLRLHDMHNDYPFLTEKMRIGNNKQEKLVSNLNDKSNYILHYLMLQAVIAKGIKMKKVHKILRFRQSKWLKPFIDFNNEKRKNATNDFEKNLMKLFSNSVYGKSIENVRKRRDVKLLNEWEGRYGAKVHIAKPNFKKLTIFNNNLIAIEMYKTQILLNKPIAIGVCVLELSKLKMYDFHYNFMLSEFNSKNCRIQYTDTDSFIYFLQDKNIYDVIKKNPEQFDTSDYCVNNPYGIGLLNKKVYGLMKDENKGHIMKEFIGLRAKMYCYKVQNGRVEKRAKGVKKCVLQKKLHFDDFYNCLFNECTITHKQSNIRSHKHRLFSISLDKKMLDPFDDKRFVCENKIETFAWGHYKLKK